MTRRGDEVPSRSELVLLGAVAALTVAVLVVLLQGVVLHRAGGSGDLGEDEVTIRCESVVGAAFPWGEPAGAVVSGSDLTGPVRAEQACADHRTGRLGVALLLVLLAVGLLVWQTQLRTWRLTGGTRRGGTGTGRLP